MQIRAILSNLTTDNLIGIEKFISNQTEVSFTAPLLILFISLIKTL
jgi:hypothetical protein